MRSFWFDPYLWVHLAGIAAVPIFLEVCLLGLAVSAPTLPTGLVLLVVGAIGVTPILWMQWQRPFSIFSLLILALPPEQLTADQRRILRLFKTPIERGLAVFASFVMLVVLWRLAEIAPLATGAASYLPLGRGTGLLTAAIAFLLSNLFFQVPVSVLRVLLTSQQQFLATEPYPVEQISRDFTLLGVQVPQILPQLTAEPAGPVRQRPPVPATPAPVPQVEDDLKRGGLPDGPVATGAILAAAGGTEQDALQTAASASETALVEGDLDELEEDWEDDFPATEIIADVAPAAAAIANIPNGETSLTAPDITSPDIEAPLETAAEPEAAETAVEIAERENVESQPQLPPEADESGAIGVDAQADVQSGVQAEPSATEEADRPAASDRTPFD